MQVPVTATPYAMVIGGGGPAARTSELLPKVLKVMIQVFQTITSAGGGYGGNVPG